MVSSIPGRSTRAAGLSQMGYACFWPNGGGLKEGLIHHGHPHQVDPTTEETEGESSRMDIAVEELESENVDSEAF